MPCTGDGSHPPRACPPRGTTGLQPVVKRRRGSGRIVRAIDPHTVSRGGTLSAHCCEGTCNTGRAGIGQVPFSALFCGDNRQTHLGGRGPPGCSGERDRWLPLGSDDLNARTRVQLSIYNVKINPCVITCTLLNVYAAFPAVLQMDNMLMQAAREARVADFGTSSTDANQPQASTSTSQHNRFHYLSW